MTKRPQFAGRIPAPVQWMAEESKRHRTADGGEHGAVGAQTDAGDRRACVVIAMQTAAAFGAPQADAAVIAAGDDLQAVVRVADVNGVLVPFGLVELEILAVGNAPLPR